MSHVDNLSCCLPGNFVTIHQIGPSYWYLLNLQVKGLKASAITLHQIKQYQGDPPPRRGRIHKETTTCVVGRGVPKYQCAGPYQGRPAGRGPRETGPR